MRAVSNMPGIAELALFDSCVTLGRVCLASVPQYLTAENVLAVMDRHDIAEALVVSNEARLVRPRRRGNRRLLEQVAGRRRLHPVWALEPPGGGDRGAAEAMVEEMLGSGVKVARLMMGQVPPLDWIWGDLCAALEARRVPCLIDMAPLRTGTTACAPDDLMVDQLARIALGHPRLPMILSHHSGGLGLSAAVMPLLRQVSNVLIDITAVVDYWRRAARELGPERVVFATGMPFYDPAVLVSNVQYDEHLDGRAKRLICGDNLRRLMEQVQ